MENEKVKDIKKTFDKLKEDEEEKLKKKNIKNLSNREILLKSARISLKNWRKSLFRQIYIFSSHIFSMYLPILKADILDSIISKNGTYIEVISSFKKYLILLISYILFRQLFEIFDYFYIRNYSTKYKCLLIKEIVEKDIEFFDVFKAGEIISKIEYCENNIQQDFIFKLFSLLQSITKLILMGYYLYKTSMDLTKIFSTIFLLQLGIDYFLDKKTFWSNYEKRMKIKSKYYNKLNELISNIRMIKSFGKEKDEVKKLEEYKNAMSPETDIIPTLFYQLSNQIGDLGEAITLLFAGKYILEKKCSLGQYTIFKQYQIEFKTTFNAIKNILKNYRKLFKDWGLFFELYDYPIKIKSLKNYIPKNINGNIKFDKVKFAYPLKPKSYIFNNLSFEINIGKIFAICGFSGSGKTTISNLLQRFYDPNEGNILLDNINLKDYNINFLRKNIGFVSQEPILNSGTIEENIVYGVENYKKSDFEDILNLCNINSFVNDKNFFPEGLKTLVGEKGIKVSGGQKQRIAIARALMKNTKILIFDEATSALDAESEAQIQNAIDNIARKKRITIIIIAHRLSTIINADIICMINNGVVVEIGKHDELIKKDGQYKKLF